MDKFGRVNLVLTRRDAEDLVDTLGFVVGMYRDGAGGEPDENPEATDRLAGIQVRIERLLSDRVR